MSTSRRLLLASLACLLSACSIPKPVLLDGPLTPFAGNKAATPAPTSPEWWTALQDPVLNGLVKTALENNFSIKAAALRLDEAHSGETSSLLRLAPQNSVDIRASQMENQRYKSNNPYAAPMKGALPTNTGTFGVSWELPFFGKTEAISAQGKAQTEQSHWQLEAAKVAVVSELVRTYAQLQGVDNDIVLMKQNAGFTGQLKTAELALVEGGVSTQTDVNRISNQQLDIELQLAGLNNQRQQLIHRLAVLTAQPALALSSAHFTKTQQPVVLAVQASALRMRPDVRVAEQAVILAAAQYGIARADLWPQFSLTGNLTLTQGVLDASGFKGTSKVLNYASGLHIPLLDWFTLKATANAKSVELKAVVQDYRQTVISAWEEAQNVYGDYVAAANSEQSAEAQAKLAEYEVTRAKEMVEVGLASKQAVWQAQVALNEKMVTVSAQHYAAIQAWAKLQKATFVAKDLPVPEPIVRLPSDSYYQN